MMLVNCDLAFKICPDYLPKLCAQKISFSNVNTTKRQLCLPMYSSSNKQEYQTTWIYPDIFKYSISIYIISIIITCIRGNNVKLVMHQISVDKIENPCY